MAKSSKGSEKTTRYRSAETGQYITKKEADKKPSKTVKETDKKSPPKKK